MPAVNPYLLFNGNAGEAVTFYQSVFGVEASITRFRDMGETPPDMPEDVLDRIANAQLPLSATNILMASDCPPGAEIDNSKPGFTVQLEADSAAEAERLFTELSADGKIEMAFGPVAWAEAFGMLTDKFSVPWMINYTGNAQM
ncbi:VOC family protein [Nocardia sp. ET3-3]|uniref:VOC family protein n=1 Tax=Nocardia terrae TaxID=2675851 RepID=A0A7K1V657_9NOCA|nr:VOC family protein [Nocardia terrae]MVU81972.1 VOC family protein [Nocardia terrae]